MRLAIATFEPRVDTIEALITRAHLLGWALDIPYATSGDIIAALVAESIGANYTVHAVDRVIKTLAGNTQIHKLFQPWAPFQVQMQAFDAADRCTIIGANTKFHRFATERLSISKSIKLA